WKQNTVIVSREQMTVTEMRQPLGLHHSPPSGFAKRALKPERLVRTLIRSESQAKVMRSRHCPFSKYAIIAISTRTIPICQLRLPAQNRLLPTTKLLIKCHDLLVAESRLKNADEAAVVAEAISGDRDVELDWRS